MVVAMIAMRMVEFTGNQVVGMIAVWNRLVPTIWTMAMPGFMLFPKLLTFGAAVWIGVAHLNDMLIEMVAMKVMEMTIVEIVDMPLMIDGGMAAVRAMLMGMVDVNVVLAGHCVPPILFPLHFL
jgi:hypothetical protein